MTAPAYPGKVLSYTPGQKLVYSPEAKEWQTQVIADGFSCGPAGADGYYGTASKAACEALQKVLGLTVDGKVGSVTWPATWQPPKVTNLQATATGTQVELTWDNGFNTQGDSIYQNGTWIAGPGGAQIPPEPPSESYLVTGLTPGTPYTFGVAAYNQYGVSAPVTLTVTVPATVTPPPPPPPPPPTTLQLGVYCGSLNPSGNALNTAAIKAFATETGADIAIAADYQNGSSDSSMSTMYPAGSWASSPYRLQLGCGVLPNGTNPSSGLAAGAAGTYNNIWKLLGENLVAAGCANALIDLALEWDNKGNAWYVGNATDAASLKQYLINIVTTMRAVPGANFQFGFYFGNQGGSLCTAAFPGAAYCDYIYLDQYDQSWTAAAGAPPWNNTCTPASSEVVWNSDISVELGKLVAFGKQYDKPIRIAEYGVINRSDGHGLGDDPTFIDNFLTWAKANAASVAYFNDNPPDLSSVLSDFPDSLAEFRSRCVVVSTAR